MRYKTFDGTNIYLLLLGIAFFTKIIYWSIQYMVACGDSPPFVGHNAFLRWSALLEVAQYEKSGDIKIWSDETVSEDFDLSIRLSGNVWPAKESSWANT